MRIEYAILIAAWLLAFILLLLVRRDRRRVALVAFLIKQWTTCLLGHAVVQLRLLSYPVREFADISRTSLTYEYMAYPAVCAIFVAYYPSNRPKLMRFGYYVLFCTALTVPEVLLERYTEVIRYEHWNWFWTWSGLFLTFLLTRTLCAAFFRTFARRHAGPEPGRASVSDHVPDPSRR